MFVSWSLLFALAPSFTASSVLPANESQPRPLQPGMLVSIYGAGLGPATACAGPEVPELCGTVVTVNGVRASLLYVQEKQINLRVPFGGAVGERAVVAVSRDGQSAAATVPVQQESAFIRLSAPAYAGMPVWIDLRLTGHHQASVRYPIRINPGDFGGHVFELRRNGVDVKPLGQAPVPTVGGGPGSPGAIGGGGFLGLPAEPKIKGRLPLHLVFRLDTPGKYEVRYTGYDWGVPGRDARVLVRSPWTVIDVAPSSSAQRDDWLRRMRDRSPSDTVELLTDFLPSLLAGRDAAVLSVLEQYAYHRDKLVRQFSLYSLYLFEDALVSKWVPDVIRRRGPTPDLAYLLSWRKDLFASDLNGVVNSLVAHLRSDSTLAAGGALQSLAFLRPQYPAATSRMDSAVMKAAPELVRRRSADVLQPLAQYLGLVKTDASRNLLWRMVDDGVVREQALVCLTWIADKRDLPRLARYPGLDYHLRQAYGDAAMPYLNRTR